MLIRLVCLFMVRVLGWLALLARTYSVSPWPSVVAKWATTARPLVSAALAGGKPYWRPGEWQAAATSPAACAETFDNVPIFFG